VKDDAVFRNCIDHALREIGGALAENGFPREPMIVSAYLHLIGRASLS
jgi:hypothetical protein